MKLNKFFIAGGILAMGLSFGACTGDLDLLPTNPNQITPGSFAEDPDGYMDQIFADVFLNYVDQGPNGNNVLSGIVSDGSFALFQRGLFYTQEACTDEATWLYYQNDGDVGPLPFGVFSTNQASCYAPYFRMVVNASLCNNFLENCNQGFFAGANPEKMAKYKVMVRTLREIAMYYLLDLYGNVPWIDDNTPVGSKPRQYSAAEIYNFLAAEMEENLKNYDPNDKPAWGYFGIDCHEAYLVKLYLNAEVYCGTPAWDKALQHAQNIINRHKGEGFQGSGLCMNYSQVFGHGNKRFAPGGNDVNEILWSLPASFGNITSWGCATMMVCGYLNDNGDLNGEDFGRIYNTQDKWNCIVARKQLVEKFDWNEPEMATSPDQRTRFWITSKDGFSYQEGAPLTPGNCPNNGYPTVKYSNQYILDDGTVDPVLSGDIVNSLFDTDYAMVRLAEIYLSAAEAILNGGGGSQADALQYVNYIRERAGLAPWTSVTLQTLRDERQRELYSECIRRTDLRRYNLWISGYNWSFKGDPDNWEGQDLPARSFYYPLPSTVVSMAGYTQNPGY